MKRNTGLAGYSIHIFPAVWRKKCSVGERFSCAAMQHSLKSRRSAAWGCHAVLYGEVTKHFVKGSVGTASGRKKSAREEKRKKNGVLARIKRVLSTISLHYQQVTATVTGLCKLFWNKTKNRLPLKARYFLFFRGNVYQRLSPVNNIHW